VQLDGVKMRYLRCGSGPNLLLLHGLLGYSFSWRFTLPALGLTRTVYAPDMPGFGFSEFSNRLDCCFSASAGRLLRFMDVAGIDSCDLLGTSFGGAVAMIAAATQSFRIRRLILVDPVNPWSAHGRTLAAILGLAPVRPVMRTLGPQMRFLRPWVLQRLYGDVARISPGTLEGYSRPFELPGAFRATTSILSSWGRDVEAMRSIFPRIANLPTLLIWGDLDRAVDPNSAPFLQRQFNNSRLVMLKGVGHLPYEEVPDDFNRVVMEFLANQR